MGKGKRDHVVQADILNLTTTEAISLQAEFLEARNRVAPRAKGRITEGPANGRMLRGVRKVMKELGDGM